jgi:four helix bundle protein
MGGFPDLDVYRRSLTLATAIRAAVNEWPRLDTWTCGIQMLRAADSIGANIAEAYGRDTYPDRRRQIYMARGSAYELEHWLTAAEARGLTVCDGAREEAGELSRMLNGLARRWSKA